MTAASTYPAQQGGRMRLRVRPLQLAILLAVVLIIGLPLFAGAERRSAVKSYIHTAQKPQRRPPGSPSSHVAPPSGGLDEQVPLTLEARLEHLLARPALDQWEAEMPSRHGCPMFTYGRNTYFFHNGKTETWEKFSKDQVRRFRRKMVEYMRELDNAGVPLVWDKSLDAKSPADRRGIIYTGAGKNLAFIRMSLHLLRNVHGCTLPIELHHMADEEPDAALKEEFESQYGVRFVVSTAKRGLGEKPWVIKNAAFIDSKFTQFIFLDADSFPLFDVTELFDTVEFKQSGSTFWSDFTKDHPDNSLFRVVGKTCSDEHSPAETGQVVYDKSGNNGLNLAALHLAHHMMRNVEMYGDMTYGDKDTFRFAFYALGLDWQMAPRMLGLVGGNQKTNGEDEEHFCGNAVLHWALTPQNKASDASYHPKPGFLHTILAKGAQKMSADRMWTTVKRPREDFISDPRLVRTLYEFTGMCFTLNLKGPDGLPDSVNSYGDGQGVVSDSLEDLIGPALWAEVQKIANKFVELNPK